MVLWYSLVPTLKKDINYEKSYPAYEFTILWFSTIMINFIENILSHFEPCFSHKVAFGRFVILTTGLILRSNRLGITSVIRDLTLRPVCYDSMLHFRG